MALLELGNVIAGKFRLLRPLAQGGMGAVWVARHLQLDVDVAVKFMAAEYAESVNARARFEREAQAAAQLHSPHVVQVYDYGITEGIPYIVMELLAGEDLGERLLREGRLPLSVAAGLIVPVCKALRRAHEAGIVHRDLKPGNIFLARHDEDEIVKVLDFGIAKVLAPASGAPGVTRTGTLIGSPHYMSPEQVRSKAIDHRSDLWSLGVVLFQAVTGKLPFDGSEVGDVLVDVCTAPIPVPSQLAPDLGPEVDRFFERALARDPAARFQSARELGEAFCALTTAPDRAISRGPSPAAPALEAGGARPGHDGGRPQAPGASTTSAAMTATAAWRGERRALVLGVASILAVAGLGGATLVRVYSSRVAPRPAASTVPVPVVGAPQPTVPPEEPAPPSPSSTPESSAPPAPSASATASPRPATPPPAKGGPPSSKRGKPAHDPLDRL
jgi:serine/threonine-protein kinase